jgi:Uma2 family endonuclease
MSTVLKHWTYDDLLELPEDNLRHEIIDGEHVVAPAPVIKHQRVAGRIYGHLFMYLVQHPIGEVFMPPCDVVFAPDNVSEPDVFYVSNERKWIIEEKNVQGAPDLVVEVISEPGRRRDEVQKKAVYERFGVAEYWIADPKVDTIRVYRRGAYDTPVTLRSNDVLTSPLFPGLALDVATLFR